MKMFKKTCITLFLSAVFSSSSFANNLNGVIGGALGGILDSVINQFNGAVFNNINQYSQGLLEVCYENSNSGIINNGSINDICNLGSVVENLQFDVCSIAPQIPGMTKKQKNIGVYGLQNFCKQQLNKTQNALNAQMVGIVEHYGLDNDSLKGTLPSGEAIKDNLKKWNFNEVMKEDSVISKYIKEGKFDEVAIFMSASKMDSKSLANFKVEDLKAPATLEEYKSAIQDSVKNIKQMQNDISADSISQIVKEKVKGKKSTSATQASNDYLSKIKEEINIAKNAEISQKLSTIKAKYPIPTQEYVEAVRFDLRPKVIAEIKEQQVREINAISEIEAKYQKKYAIAKLIADKEIILAQEFDEGEARAFVESIANSSNVGGGIGGILP